MSLAFPDKASEADVVEIVVLPGDEMLNAGAVVSFGGGGGVRVIVSVVETLVVSSVGRPRISNTKGRKPSWRLEITMSFANM